MCMCNFDSCKVLMYYYLCVLINASNSTAMPWVLSPVSKVLICYLYNIILCS